MSPGWEGAQRVVSRLGELPGGRKGPQGPWRRSPEGGAWLWIHVTLQHRETTQFSLIQLTLGPIDSVTYFGSNAMKPVALIQICNEQKHLNDSDLALYQRLMDTTLTADWSCKHEPQEATSTSNNV